MRKMLGVAIVLAFWATPAMASILNTAHDLSSSSDATLKSDNQTELCIFCHTPHAASTSVDNAPLWNRSHTPAALEVTDLYDSTTLETDSKPAAVVDAVNASDALLCLSCHDGTSMAGGLVNPSNADGDPTFAGGAAISSGANLFDDTNMLTNDHPIGMDYATVATDDDGLNLDPGLRFFGGIMWCASCHNVHDNTHEPFLAQDNAASALCLKCHNK